MATMLRNLLSIPVFSVLTAMALVYYTTVFHFLEDAVGSDSFAGLLNLILVTVFAVCTFHSFFVSVLTDPGRVPSNYVPDVEGEQRSSQGIGNHNSRRCDKCSSYKPPRAHHCRVCRSCILKMDHHCVWINNCVGFKNYKAFILLLLYGTICSTYCMMIFIISTLRRDWVIQDASVKGYYVAYGVLIVGLCITLVTLFGWHVYLLAHNMTTIEYYEGLRAAWLARKSGQSYHHAFDVGAYRNLTTILGPNVLKWLWPNATSHLKDGTAFPMQRDSS